MYNTGIKAAPRQREFQSMPRIINNNFLVQMPSFSVCVRKKLL